MKNFIIIHTNQNDVVSPDVAISLKNLCESLGITVESISEINESEIIDWLTGNREVRIEIPKDVADGQNEIKKLITVMRRSGATNHDITRAIEVASMIDTHLADVVKTLSKHIEIVSPDVRIVINPIVCQRRIGG